MTKWVNLNNLNRFLNNIRNEMNNKYSPKNHIHEHTHEDIKNDIIKLRERIEYLEELGIDSGATGPTGPQGKSAYEVYKDTVELGGTVLGVTDWLESLRGPQGYTGAIGPKGATGAIGPKGATGPTPKLQVEVEVEEIIDSDSIYTSNVRIEEPTDSSYDSKLVFTFPSNIVKVGNIPFIDDFQSIAPEYGKMVFNTNSSFNCVCVCYGDCEIYYTSSDSDALTVVADDKSPFDESIEVRLSVANNNAPNSTTYYIGNKVKPQTKIVWYTYDGRRTIL